MKLSDYGETAAEIAKSREMERIYLELANGRNPFPERPFEKPKGRWVPIKEVKSNVITRINK